MSTTSTNPSVRLIGLITCIAGIIMIIAGAATWGMVTTQLKSEGIVVAAVTPENPGSLAGKPVAGPFTAYAQAAAIKFHTLENGAHTYSQLGTDATALKAKLAAAGVSKADIATNKDVVAIATARTTAMNGSFLRASLFTSVISFGVAALVMGVGLLFALLGFALRKVGTVKVVTAPAKVGVKAGVKAGVPVIAHA